MHVSQHVTTFIIYRPYYEMNITVDGSSLDCMHSITWLAIMGIQLFVIESLFF